MAVKIKKLLLSLTLPGAVFILASCASSGTNDDLPPPAMAPQAIGAATDPAAFQPGDTVELFVKEDPTLNGTYPVREGGYIVIPRAGRIPVAGLDRASAESRVKDMLQRTQLKEATVLVERTPQPGMGRSAVGGPPGVAKIMVYVTGSVPRSGAHYVPLPSGRSLGVYETLLITGGLAKFSQEQRVELFRADAAGKRHRKVIDIRAVRQGTMEDPVVGEGDIIHVPEKVFGF